MVNRLGEGDEPGGQIKAKADEHGIVNTLQERQAITGACMRPVRFTTFCDHLSCLEARYQPAAERDLVMWL